MSNRSAVDLFCCFEDQVAPNFIAGLDLALDSNRFLRSIRVEPVQVLIRWVTRKRLTNRLPNVSLMTLSSLSEQRGP